jgi:hypothetical protein
MVEVKKVEGVLCQNANDYQCNGEDLVYQDENKNLKRYNFLEDEHEVIKNTGLRFNNLTYFNSAFIFNDLNSHFYEFSNKGFNAIENDLEIYFNHDLDSSFSLARRTKSDWNYDYFIYDILKKTICFQIDTDLDFFYADFAFVSENNSIFCYKIEEKGITKVWELDLSTLPKYDSQNSNSLTQDSISRWIGVFNNVLWISFTSTKVIGFDLNSGKILFDIFDGVTIGKDANGGEMIFNLGSVLNLDSENGLLIGLWDSYYLEYDLNSNSPYLKKIDLKNQFLDFHPFAFDMKDIGFLQFNNSYILGYDKMEGKFCVFDRETKNINSKVKLDFGDRKGGGAKILSSLICENHVVIGDCFGTLRIFQTE